MTSEGVVLCYLSQRALQLGLGQAVRLLARELSQLGEVVHLIGRNTDGVVATVSHCENWEQLIDEFEALVVMHCQEHLLFILKALFLELSKIVCTVQRPVGQGIVIVLFRVLSTRETCRFQDSAFENGSRRST